MVPAGRVHGPGWEEALSMAGGQQLAQGLDAVEETGGLEGGDPHQAGVMAQLVAFVAQRGRERPPGSGGCCLRSGRRRRRPPSGRSRWPG